MKQEVPKFKSPQLLPFGYLSAQHFVEFLDYGPHLYTAHTHSVSSSQVALDSFVPAPGIIGGALPGRTRGRPPHMAP